LKGFWSADAARLPAQSASSIAVLRSQKRPPAIGIDLAKSLL